MIKTEHINNLNSRKLSTNAQNNSKGLAMSQSLLHRKNHVKKKSVTEKNDFQHQG